MLKSEGKNNLGKNTLFIKPGIRKYSVKSEIKYRHILSRYSGFFVPFRVIYSICLHIRDIKKRPKASKIDVLTIYKKGPGSHFQKIAQSIFVEKEELKVLYYNEYDYIFRPLKISRKIYSQFFRDLKKLDNILTFGVKSILALEFIRFQSLMEFYKPHLIFCFNEHSKMQGLLSYVAQLNDIGIVNMAHGFSRGEFRANSPYDYHIVFGQASRNEILKMNGDIDGEIIPLGAPNTDELFKMSRTGEGSLSHFPQNKLKKILIFSTYVYKKGNINFLINNFSIIKRLSEISPHYRILIKKHPNSYRFAHLRNLEDDFFRGCMNIEILPFETPSIHTIKSCDLGITIGMSNAGYETAILGKPLIVLDLYNSPDFFEYYKYNYALKAEDFDSLFQAIKKVESGNHPYSDGIKKMLDYYYSNQGYAGEEIYRFLLKIVDHRDKKTNDSNIKNI